MTSSIKRLLKGYKFGWLEFIFAMFPILWGYQYGSIPFNLLIPLIMIIMAVYRGMGSIKMFHYKPLKLLFAFVVLHQLLVGFFINPPGYFWNSLLVLVINLLAIYVIVPAINYEKMRSSLYLVALISIAGLVYHFIILMAGGTITPLTLPFLPELSSESRAFEESMRPCSFFWEPAACVTFLMIPLFLALNDRKYLWAAGIMFSIFLSTSTNGIALSSIMVAITIFTQNVKMRYKMLMVLIMIGMAYMLITSEMFSGGMDKINNTDLEANARTMNGIILFHAMPFEHILAGFPAANIDDYVASGQIHAAFFAKENIFLPSFWFILSKYVLLGLFIYFSTYLFPLKKCRELIPYITVLIVALFTQGINLDAGYIFQMVFILTFMKHFCNTQKLTNQKI